MKKSSAESRVSRARSCADEPSLNAVVCLFLVLFLSMVHSSVALEDEPTEEPVDALIVRAPLTRMLLLREAMALSEGDLRLEQIRREFGYGGTGAAEDLIAMIGEPQTDEAMRCAAALMLHYSDSSSARSLESSIRQLMRDSRQSQHVRGRLAARLLREFIDGYDVRQTLYGCLRPEIDVSVKRGAVFCLTRYAFSELEPSVKPVMDELYALQADDSLKAESDNMQIQKLNYRAQLLGFLTSHPELEIDLRDAGPIVKDVGNANVQVRSQAVLALGNLRGDDLSIVLDEIGRALEEDDREVRLAAILAAKRLGERSAPLVRKLAALLGNIEDRLQTEGILNCLDEIGLGAFAALPMAVPLLTNENADLRKSAVRAVSQIGCREPGTAPKIIKALHDEDEAVRSAASFRLRDLQVVSDETAEEVFDEVYRGKLDQYETAVIFRVLSRTGQIKRNLARLLKMFPDVDGHVQHEILGAIRQLGPEAAEVRPAVEAIDPKGDEVIDVLRYWCLISISSPETRRLLLANLVNPKCARGCIGLLLQHQPEKNEELFIDILYCGSPEVQDELLDRLPELSGQKYWVRVIKAATQCKNPLLRRFAELLSGKIPDNVDPKKVSGILIELLPFEPLKEQTQRMLIELGDPAAEALVAAFADDESSIIRRDFAETLVRMPNQAAKITDGLRTFLTGEDQACRHYSALVFVGIAPREPRLVEVLSKSLATSLGWWFQRESALALITLSDAGVDCSRSLPMLDEILNVSLNAEVRVAAEAARRVISRRLQRP